MDSFTASAVTLLPLENLALSLILKVQVILSSDTDQLSANQGCVFILSSNLANVSPTP